MLPQWHATHNGAGVTANPPAGVTTPPLLSLSLTLCSRCICIVQANKKLFDDISVFG